MHTLSHPSRSPPTCPALRVATSTPVFIPPQPKTDITCSPTHPPLSFTILLPCRVQRTSSLKTKVFFSLGACGEYEFNGTISTQLAKYSSRCMRLCHSPHIGSTQSHTATRLILGAPDPTAPFPIPNCEYRRCLTR